MWGIWAGCSPGLPCLRLEHPLLRQLLTIDAELCPGNRFQAQQGDRLAAVVAAAVCAPAHAGERILDLQQQRPLGIRQGEHQLAVIGGIGAVHDVVGAVVSRFLPSLEILVVHVEDLLLLLQQAFAESLVALAVYLRSRFGGLFPGHAAVSFQLVPLGASHENSLMAARDDWLFRPRSRARGKAARTARAVPLRGRGSADQETAPTAPVPAGRDRDPGRSRRRRRWHGATRRATGPGARRTGPRPGLRRGCPRRWGSTAVAVPRAAPASRRAGVAGRRSPSGRAPADRGSAPGARCAGGRRHTDPPRPSADAARPR